MTFERTLPVCVLRGEPRERGRQHGAAFREQIASALATWRLCQTPSDLSLAMVRAKTSWRLLRGVAPHLVDEIEGIAEATDCDPLDLYLRIGFEFSPQHGATGCSAMAIATPKGALIGQNWDAPPADTAELAVFLHIEPDGRRTAVIAPIGGLGWVGLNSFGLGLLTNDLILRGWSAGLPSQAIRRLVLEASSVGRALDRLRDLPHMSGRAYLLGDASGRIAGVEVSPELGVRSLPDEARLFHTNHALIPDVAALQDHERLAAVYPSSTFRHDDLITCGQDASDLPAIRRALSSRHGAPNAVSKSPSATEPTETGFSVIFDSSAARLSLCAGRPSEDRYISFGLADLDICELSRFGAA